MKNAQAITKVKNTIDPANIKAAAAKAYEDVVKAPIAKTQAAMEKMEEQLARLIGWNNDLALEGALGHSGWRIEVEDTNLNFQRFDGDGNGEGDLNKNLENIKFIYKNNPMENPKAAKDIIENPDAVYGYSPNPESARIGKFAEYDWTDEKVVANAREARLQYHKDNESIYNIVKEMQVKGATIKEIALIANQQRNINRLQSYIDRGNIRGYEKAVESNLKNFQNELGMTAEQAYEKYGSWETVLEKAMSANAGMDACCGLYDDFYHLYPVGGK